MYTLRHLATGPLPQVLPPDVVISWCHFLQTWLPATCRWKMAPRLGGFLVSVPRLDSFVWGGISYLGTLCSLWLFRPRYIAVQRLLWLIYHKFQSCFFPFRLFCAGSHVRFQLWPHRFLLRFPLCQFLYLLAESSAVSLHSVVDRAWFLLWL